MNVFGRFLLSNYKLTWLRVYFLRKMDGLLRRKNNFPERYILYRYKNFRLLLDRKSLIDSNIMLNGSWEKRQIEVLSSVIKIIGADLVTFIDVGAYWGLYSLVAKSLGVKTIYAFEPDKKNHSQFLSQIFLNDFFNDINIYKSVLSNYSGTINFTPSTEISNNNRAIASIAGSSDQNSIEVDCIDFDSIFLESHKYLVIKIDVEGHEMQVLEGMKSTIENNICFIQVEFNCNADAKKNFLEENFKLRFLGNLSVDYYFTNSSDFLSIQELN